MTPSSRGRAHFLVSGRNLDPARVARAIALSARKHRSVSIVLGKTAEMSHDFEIVESSESGPRPG